MASPVDFAHVLTPGLFDSDDLLPEVLASLNAGELARRRFREIARIAGLVFTGYPGAPKSTRQLQASSGLYFDVFRQHDPDNLLLAQARQEVLSQELDVRRLRQTLQRLQSLHLEVCAIARPTPFAFPLLVERFRESLSSEKLADRIRRMVAELEQAAGPGGGESPPVDPRMLRIDGPEPARSRRPGRAKDGRPRPARQRS